MENKDLRERFRELMENNLQQLENDLQELEPKDRVKTILDIARFVLPTLKSVESRENVNIEQPLFNIHSLYSVKD